MTRKRIRNISAWQKPFYVPTGYQKNAPKSKRAHFVKALGSIFVAESAPTLMDQKGCSTVGNSSPYLVIAVTIL